jgi:NAD(P)-dependent dehydrogenase (short-subunit alcohol dehydrogenase family)
MSGLAGKVAVVTGVTSGVGRATVAALIAEGATVVGLGRDADKLAACRAVLGERFRPEVADLADPAARTACVARLADRLERVDVVVNNAAACVYAEPLALSIGRWRDLFEINVLAAIELVAGLAGRLAPGGAVVNVSSVTAEFLPSARFAPYATSKVALDAFTEALRLELTPRGGKVTLLRLGLVDTPIYDKVEGFAETRRRIERDVPTWLSADDVGRAFHWILAAPPHVVVGELELLPVGQAR